MSRLRRARGAGRTKPPEEHYAEAEGSSGRLTKAFPARRTLRVGRLPGPFSSLRFDSNMRMDPQSDRCEKKKSQIAVTSSPGRLTAARGRPRVLLAPSTERPRLMAFRSAPASAEVSRKAGRRRHRLGAFFVPFFSGAPSRTRRRLRNGGRPNAAQTASGRPWDAGKSFVAICGRFDQRLA